MATLREYFDTDPKAMTLGGDWILHRGDQPYATVRAKVAHDLEANAKYWYLFLPEVDDPIGAIQYLFGMPQMALCALDPAGDGIRAEIGFADDPDRQSTETLIFTGRVLLYCDAMINAEQRRAISEAGRAKGLLVSLRDRGYALRRSEYEKPLAFISHDSRDKDALVRELAHKMTQLMCPVWYDEFSLKVGDSLRATIEKGLREARKCVLVLSPNFLGNNGWTKAEFDSIFTREILEQKNVILPVWHNVDARSVYEYSPRLADKVGLPSTLGIEELARRLTNAIKTGV